MCVQTPVLPSDGPLGTSYRNKNNEMRGKAKVRVLCNSTMLEKRWEDSLIRDQSSVVSDVWENVSFFIKYWDLSDEEATKFLEVRDRVSDLKHRLNRPGAVVRYLRARSFDVEKSETMIRETVAWRLNHGVDSILKDYKPPQALQNYYPGAILKGTDKVGDPIYLSRTGVTDLFGLIDKYGDEELFRFEVYRRESALEGDWIQEWEKNAGRPIQRTIIIEDLQGLNRRFLASKVTRFYSRVCDMDDRYYPETNKKIIIIRAPTLFRFVWAVVKRFFDPYVVSKMEFCGDNYCQVLEKHMDLAVLPPCIYPEGKGEAVAGLSPLFEGGNVM